MRAAVQAFRSAAPSSTKHEQLSHAVRPDFCEQPVIRCAFIGIFDIVFEPFHIETIRGVDPVPTRRVSRAWSFGDRAACRNDASINSPEVQSTYPCVRLPPVDAGQPPSAVLGTLLKAGTAEANTLQTAA